MVRLSERGAGGKGLTDGLGDSGFGEVLGKSLHGVRFYVICFDLQLTRKSFACFKIRN